MRPKLFAALVGLEDDHHLHHVGVVAVGVDDEAAMAASFSRGVPPSRSASVPAASSSDHRSVKSLVQHLVLGPEVVVDEPVGNAGLAGDVGNAAVVKALAGEDADRGVEDDATLVRGLGLCLGLGHSGSMPTG